MAFSASTVSSMASSGMLRDKTSLQPLSSRPSMQPRSCRSQVACQASLQRVMGKIADTGKVAFAASAAAILLSTGPASAGISYDDLQGLSYLQVKGSGIANTCPVIEEGSSNPRDLKPGNYRINKLCMEPTSFTVKEEGQFRTSGTEFTATKLMTRLTYTLDQMEGDFNIDEGGNVYFKEEDGMDYAAVTVQLPGGERVPFLFTVKELEAKGTLDGFGGDFMVPSYRGATFMDPKARGTSQGYDNFAVALPGMGDAEELEKENIKTAAPMKGQIVLSVAKVDPETNEIAGVFESLQPSDTDLGSKAPKDVKIIGIWYGQLS